MLARSTVLLSLLLLTACDEKAASTDSSGARKEGPSERSRGSRPTRSDGGPSIELARNKLSELSPDTNAKERGEAIAAIAKSFAQTNLREGVDWILLLEDPQERELAWSALLVAGQESAPRALSKLYDQLEDPTAKEQYLAALTSNKVLETYPSLAWSTLKDLPQTEEQRAAMMDDLLKKHVFVSPEKAWESYRKYANSAPEESFILKFPTIDTNSVIPGAGPKFPIEVIDGINDPSLQAVSTTTALGRLDIFGRRVVAKWLAERSAEPRFDKSYAILARTEDSPEMARTWANRITDETVKAEVMTFIETSEAQRASPDPK